MDLLTKKNDYSTDNRSIPFPASHFPGLVFYLKMAGIVLRSSRLAKKGMYTGDVWARSSLNVLRSLESVGVQFRIENMHSVRRMKIPCVFIGNHMSTLETFVLPCLLQPHLDITFIVKESLIAYPVFKHVMISRNPVVVGRSNPRQDLQTILEEGQKRLEKNISIVVFPQTTRSTVFDPVRFNSIGVKLARRAGVPVVPVALKTDAWGNGKRIKDFGKICPDKPVHFCFGDPIQVTGNGRQEHAEIIRFIENRLEAWS